MVILSLLLTHTSFAGSATWKVNPTNGDWNTAVNWMPSTVPDGPNDVATFGTSNTTSISLSAMTTAKSITFNSGSSTFSITVPGETGLSFSDVGITNNSGQTQKFIAVMGAISGGGAIVFNGTASAGNLTHFSTEGLPGFTLDSSRVEFHDSSSAGGGEFVCHPGIGSSEGVPGNVQFFDFSSAGDAEIILEGGIVSVGRSGKVFFNNASSAANATATAFGGTVDQADGALIDFSGSTTADYGTFIANGGTASGAEGAEINFSDFSTAAEGTFIINGGAVPGAAGGELNFYQHDSPGAGNATVIINGGAGEGGTCSFVDNDPNGGTARFAIFGNGTLRNIAGSNHPLTIGSIEGDGNVTTSVFTTLAIGSNNLSTLFSGIISASGAIAKVGTGTLTLTGANTYAGGTTVSDGTLVISNTAGSGTGTGEVQVEAGVLGGSGTISNTVTAGTGSGPGAFLAPATGTKKQATLTIQSALTFNSDATYTCTFKARRNKARSDKVVANGVTINSGATFSFQGTAQGTLQTGLVLPVISNTAATPIAGAFSNLADGAILTVNGNNFQADYEGGDGNDLTLTVVP